MFAVAAFGQQSGVPELARLKLAAESGVITCLNMIMVCG